GFGYLVDYREEENAYYIFKPKSLVRKVQWAEDGQQLEVVMDELTPYRINMTDDPKKLILELEQASLAKNFQDQVSNDQYYLTVNRIENQSSLQLELKSKYPIPFQVDKGIRETEDSLQLRFLPRIQSISWTEDEYMEISANADIKKPSIKHLKNPDRIVLDFPGLMLSDFDLDFEKNEWIKDVRVSQFTYDPIVLRVVLEVEPNKDFDIVSTDQENRILLRPATETIISNLAYTKKAITFNSNNPIEPGLFTLENPERLVINLENCVKSDDLPEQIEVGQDNIEKLRTARFEEDLIRIVADLEQLQNYEWEQEKQDNGLFRHRIFVGEKFDNILLEDQENYTNIKIEFNGNVEYDMKKFSYPHRLVVDIADDGVSPEEVSFPEPAGIINKMRTSRFEKEGQQVTRMIFELENYNDYKLLSDKPDKVININLLKPGAITRENIIVLDPGHGGFDPGAVGPSGVQEKELTLELALATSDLLEDKGYNIVLTREKDEFLSLRERVKLANETQARLFVSVHINASHKNYSEGTETFLAPAKSGESRVLASQLQESLVGDLNLFDRGVKRENFYVIKYTEMPAALVEVAFISNPHEESLLSSDLFKRKAARSLARGIENYLQKYKN
ncbi:MAG: N-acetylmuramoyl-L-alanine amidase, partial [Bacillota bacterium]